MKVKDLIKMLSMYEDHEVEAVISFQPYAGAKTEYLKYEITDLREITEASKKVVLNTEYKGEGE